MMKFKMIVILVFFSLISIACLVQEVSADSFSFSNDKINIAGIKANGVTLTFSHPIGNGYSYETYISRTGTYIEESSNGDTYSKHIADITAFGIGISRTFSFSKLNVVPYIGVQHTTLNVESSYLYYKRFRLGPYDHLVNLNATVYSTKTIVLPSIGLTLEYMMHPRVGVFIKGREQGYSTAGIGINVRF